MCLLISRILRLSPWQHHPSIRRIDLGYQFSNSRRQVNILQYADDTCLVASSPAACQHLLNITSDWLQWSGMEAKVPKCLCLSLQGSTGRLADPHLALNGVPIPFSTSSVRFLGMQVQVPKNHTAAREAVLTKLRKPLNISCTWCLVPTVPLYANSHTSLNLA